ncbi:MAG: Holliday junction resolvase RuvX [Phycisphaerales bacterium JB061]
MAGPSALIPCCIRYLAVDLGDKRTGLALGNSATAIVTPIGMIDVQISHGGGNALLEAIARVAVEQLGEDPRREAGEIVVGLPMNMDGTEGPRAKAVRSFADRLGQRTGRAVRVQDERLTSVEADWRMSGSGMTHKQKKMKRDALAAAAILRDYLESLGTTPERTQEPTPETDWRDQG